MVTIENKWRKEIANYIKGYNPSNIFTKAVKKSAF